MNACKYAEKLKKCLGGMQVGEFVWKKQAGKREEGRKPDQKSVWKGEMSVFVMGCRRKGRTVTDKC